ncbi:hypothetical protein [Halomonas sp. KM-1]|uniref:hypothetical protein n=1 Tax=Halomonas sp. KM-1 TaxID=590061 RepID=UPI00351CB09E
MPGSTYRRWRKQPTAARLDVNQLERMSLILGIYKALQILLPRADAWLRRPNHNPLFAGQLPLIGCSAAWCRISMWSASISQILPSTIELYAPRNRTSSTLTRKKGKYSSVLK